MLKIFNFVEELFQLKISGSDKNLMTSICCQVLFNQQKTPYAG